VFLRSPTSLAARLSAGHVQAEGGKAEG